MISVKVCGLSNPLNILAVAGAGPDFLGFVFYPGSPRFAGRNLDPVKLREVAGGMTKVGVFVNESPEHMLDLADSFGFKLVQLHGNEPVSSCEALKKAGFSVIKAFGLVEGFDFRRMIPFVPVCDYFLFDTKTKHHGGTGKKFNWDILSRYTFDIPFFLSGGIGPGDTDAIREFTHPAFYGVDINSRFETEPGMKNIDQVTSFIKAIKTFKT
jgi:phosphoribosylanthranilate isomerase